MTLEPPRPGFDPETDGIVETGSENRISVRSDIDPLDWPAVPGELEELTCPRRRVPTIISGQNSMAAAVSITPTEVVCEVRQSQTLRATLKILTHIDGNQH